MSLTAQRRLELEASRLVLFSAHWLYSSDPLTLVVCGMARANPSLKDFDALRNHAATIIEAPAFPKTDDHFPWIKKNQDV